MAIESIGNNKSTGNTRERLDSHLNNLNEIQKFQALKKLAHMENSRFNALNKTAPTTILNLNG